MVKMLAKPMNKWRFSTVWKKRENLYVVLDTYSSEKINQIVSGMEPLERALYMSNMEDTFFGAQVIDSIFFDSKSEAERYLTEYGCLFDDMEGEYGDVVLSKIEHLGQSDLYFVGDVAVVRLEIETIVLV